MVVVFLCWLVACTAMDYIVAPGGRVGAMGSLGDPYSTVGDCLRGTQPGDRCLLRGGRYHTPSSVVHVHGTENQPIIIAPYGSEKVILDGTVPIPGPWKLRAGSRCVYEAHSPQPVWQLFDGDDMLTPARWPNGALWRDKTVFDDGLALALSSKQSTLGKMVDDGSKDLAGQNFSAVGAVAVLNIGSWITVASRVASHHHGTGTFTYHVPSSWHQHLSFNPVHGRYFLEAHLDLLDQETEWYFDQATGTVSVWLEGCRHPSTTSIRGKVQTYGLNVTDSSHLVYSGLTFFGTAWQVTTKSHHITFDSCDFTYPSFSKRMLGVVDAPLGNSFNNRRISGGLTVHNCTFTGADGPVLEYRGVGGTFDNNLWQYNGYSCVGDSNDPPTNTAGSISSKGSFDVFVRNTVTDNGPSNSYAPGPFSYVYFNRFDRQSNLQHDGAHLQCHINAQNGTVITHSWASNTPKKSWRFDRIESPTAPWGYNGTIQYTVSWNTSGIMVKGDKHHVGSNLVFGLNNPKALDINVRRYDPQAKWGAKGENNHTVVDRNGADTMGGSPTHRSIPLGGITTDNLQDPSIAAMLVDPEHLDFRPKPGSVLDSKGIGPYSAHNDTYWIPGRQGRGATTPIPPCGSINVPRQYAALMWLEGNGAHHSVVYWGEDRSDVATGGEGHHLRPGSNVFPLSQWDTVRRTSHKTYFWRVDTWFPRGDVVVGDVWEFTTD